MTSTHLEVRLSPLPSGIGGCRQVNDVGNCTFW